MEAARLRKLSSASELLLKAFRRTGGDSDVLLTPSVDDFLPNDACLGNVNVRIISHSRKVENDLISTNFLMFYMVICLRVKHEH